MRVLLTTILAFLSLLCTAQFYPEVEARIFVNIDSNRTGSDREGKIYSLLEEASELYSQNTVPCSERDPILDTLGLQFRYWKLGSEGEIIFDPHGPYGELLLTASQKYPRLRGYAQAIISSADISPSVIPFLMDEMNRLNLQDPIIQRVVYLHYYILCHR